MRVASLLFVLISGAAAPANAALTDDAAAACGSLADAEVVFIGRAQPVVAYRASFEPEIRKARETWLTAQAEWERFRASHVDVTVDPERASALQSNAADAQTEFYRTRAMYPEPRDVVLTPMQVEVAFRGIATESVSLEMGGLAPFEVGRSYLVYGRRARWPFGPHVVRPTRSPREAAEAEEEVRFLEVAAPAVPGGIVFGGINLEHALESSRPSSSLGGVTLRISAEGYLHDAVTAADGSFLVAGVPAGPVEISARLPDRLTITNRSSLNAHLSQGGCAPVRLQAALNGRVRGRVVGRDGKPKPQLRVQLLSLDPKPYYLLIHQRFTQTTNELGEFEFHAIPPGAFLLGHNLYPESHVILVNDVKPPATYFPGTPNRSAAVPVVVGDGTEHNGFEFSVVW